MKKLMEQMAEELSAAFEKSGYDPSYGKVTVSNRPDLCEFQCNGAMAGAKAYKKAPFMIADDVVAYLKDSQVFSMAEVVKPGFINKKVKADDEFDADTIILATGSKQIVPPIQGIEQEFVLQAEDVLEN